MIVRLALLLGNESKIPEGDIGRSAVDRPTRAPDHVRYPRCYGHFQRAEISKTASLLSFGDSCFSKELLNRAVSNAAIAT